MTYYWFKVLKFSNKENANVSKKYDICGTYANSQDEAYNKLISQVVSKGYLQCDYFSEGVKYPRSIHQVINLIPITEKEALKIKQHFTEDENNNCIK